jgi:TPR repeat protein
MSRAEREAEGLRIWALACDLEEEGRIEVAIELYRVSARFGWAPSQLNLAGLLGDRAMPGPSPEALYWLRRLGREDPGSAAWNIAMYHRQRGRRRLYFHWLEKAAAAGEEGAVAALGDRERLKQAWWALDGVWPPPRFRLRSV